MTHATNTGHKRSGRSGTRWAEEVAAFPVFKIFGSRSANALREGLGKNDVCPTGRTFDKFSRNHYFLPTRIHY